MTKSDCLRAAMDAVATLKKGDAEERPPGL